MRPQAEAMQNRLVLLAALLLPGCGALIDHTICSTLFLGHYGQCMRSWSEPAGSVAAPDPHELAMARLNDMQLAIARGEHLEEGLTPPLEPGPLRVIRVRREDSIGCIITDRASNAEIVVFSVEGTAVQVSTWGGQSAWQGLHLREEPRSCAAAYLALERRSGDLDLPPLHLEVPPERRTGASGPGPDLDQLLLDLDLERRGVPAAFDDDHVL
jgi:hypothetical protein